MKKFTALLTFLTYLQTFFHVFTAYGQQVIPPTENRVPFISITASFDTGQEYSPWLNDNLNDLVQSQWSPANSQYVDVKIVLAYKSNISRISLYDYEGIFSDKPAFIYAQNGTQKTLLGVFTGEKYLQWVELKTSTPVTADAIIIHKYGNNIPQKVQVYGSSSKEPALEPSIIGFPELSIKTVRDGAFELFATSNNSVVPVTFVSSNPTVVFVSNATGRWQATVGAVGTATITASQAGSSAYSAAANVSRSLTVQAATMASSGTGKIPIDPLRWYQLTNSPDGIAQLFDGITSKNISTGWGRIIGTYDSYYPLQAGETFSIERIKFFDGQGSNANAPMTLSIITDNWQRIPIATFTGTQYEEWVGPNPNRSATFALDNVVRNARYLVITSSGGYPTEIELYGSYTMPASRSLPLPSDLATQKQIRFKQSLGVNAFEWDLEDPTHPSIVDTVRLNAVKNFAGIRHYLDWEKLEWREGNYSFNPSHRGGWNYDAMYERLKQEGVEVLVCLKDMPPWLQATYPLAERAGDNVPVRYGKSFSSPTSYIEQARVGFQFVARYGSNPNVNRSLLSVTTYTNWEGEPANQVKVGLGFIKYIECDNERDKWWAGRKAHQTAHEYAAHLSAFYDGHKNTMGPGVGVKNADPTIQVVMAGLSVASPDYVKGMIDWCRQHRGYRADGSVNLCWDVINYHLYSDNGNSSQSGTSTRGTAPEVSKARETAQAFVQMAHQYADDMPVWITETGYDLNQGSPLKAIAIGNRSVVETQADWTLRTALAYARWGVERVFMYQLYDDNPTNPTQFGSMGLVNSDKTYRPAAQYLNQANKLIGTYTYKETLNQDPIVDRYELNGQSAYALVVPDERGRTSQYILDLGTATYADVYRPTVGSPTMAVQRIDLQNGQLTIQVTETPVFVLAAGTTINSPNVCSATGTILREEWSNAPGNLIADIPLQAPATSTNQITQFQSIANASTNYGERIRGYVCPPQSGAYTFFITGDNKSELWLSTDDDPTHKTRIAACSVWTASPTDWYRSPSQQSAAVQLVAGRRYYIEALHKQGWGDSYIAVAWHLPDGTLEGPIANNRFSPFISTASRMSSAVVMGDTITTVTTKSNKELTLTAFPNPFTSETNIQFKLATAGKAILALYDLQGRLVQQLFTGKVPADKIQDVRLQAHGLPGGIYTIRLTTDTKVEHQRVVLTR